MKIFLFLVSFMVLLIPAIVSANSVWVEARQNGIPRDTLYNFSPIELRVHVANTVTITGISLGFELSGDPNIQWEWDNPKAIFDQWTYVFDLTGTLVIEDDTDGILPDVIMVGGAALTPVPPTQSYFSFMGTANYNGGSGGQWTLCLDSTFVPPAGNFVFVDEFGVGFTPAWFHGNQPRCWVVDAWTYYRGDANWDLAINVADAVYIVNFVFNGAPPPLILPIGDPNCDRACNVADAVYLVNYIFKGGSPPCGPLPPSR